MGSQHGDLMRETRDTAKNKFEAAIGLTFGTKYSVLKPFCPDWIDQANWEKLIDECWNTQSWKKVSVVNKRNWGMSANEEKATHCGGSCSLVHMKLKMEKKKGGPVSFIDVYDSYYTKKWSTSEQPSQFVTQKAKTVGDEYRCLATEKFGSSIPLDIDTDLWEQACGGMKKGRMFRATKDILHISSLHASTASSSTSQMASDDEVQKLKDKLAECEERDRVREERDWVKEDELKTLQEQVALLTKAYKEKFPPPPS